MTPRQPTRGWLRSLSVLKLAGGAAYRSWRFSLRRFPTEAARARAQEELWRSEGERLRASAVRLGGLLIKVGQFLSARADVLPESFTRPLGSLQDVVPAVAWGQVKPGLERALGQPVTEVFESFDTEPLAAASLAQVYRASYRGRRVAVKVLRPGIEESVQTDLRAVRVAASWASRLTEWGRRFDLMTLWAELAEVTLQELDLAGEASRLERFRSNFKGDPDVRAPGVVRELTRRRVLVMDEMTGIKPDDRQRLLDAGIDPVKVARILVRSFMKQWMVDGLFHADPHPGNLFVEPDGSVTYLDFGMMGEVLAEDREQIQALTSSVIRQDTEGMVSALERLQFLRPTTHRARLKRAVGLLVNRLLSAPPPAQHGWEEGPEVDELVREIRFFLHDNTLQLPARYAFLGRSLGIVGGVVAKLAPDEPFVRLMAKEARRYLGESGLGWKETARDLLARALSPLRRALAVLDKLDSGTLKMDIDLAPLITELRTERRSRRAISLAILAGFSLIVAAFSHLPTVPQDLFWAAAAVLTLLTVMFRP